MAETPLKREHILDTAADVLRRHGPAKATVTDIARALNVSPGSIYRHFPSKVALRAAVTREWLDQIHAGLPEIADTDSQATQRLQDWLRTLYTTKKQYAIAEPELFDTYSCLVAEHSEAAVEHVEDLLSQLTRIIRSGIERKEFGAADPDRLAQAVFSAMDRFHNPLHVQEWKQPTTDETFDSVLALLLAGLTARTENPNLKDAPLGP